MFNELGTPHFKLVVDPEENKSSLTVGTYAPVYFNSEDLYELGELTTKARELFNDRMQRK